MRLFLLLLFAVSACAQTVIDDAAFAKWRSNNIDFVLIDVRGDANPDSLAYPSFYVKEAATVVTRRGCNKRLLIICHNGGLAATEAQKAIDAGYPADSVYVSGYNVLTSSRYPISDTLPVAFLDKTIQLPQDMSAQQLYSVRVSARKHKIIDIRSDQEIADEGLIPGACHIEWPDSFKASYGQFDADEDMILYCRSGNRAGQAQDWLLQNGFKSEKVINFRGFSKWVALNVAIAGKPVARCQCEQYVGAIYRPPSGAVPWLNGSNTAAGAAYDVRGRLISPQGTQFSTGNAARGMILLRNNGSRILNVD